MASPCVHTVRCFLGCFFKLNAVTLQFQRQVLRRQICVSAALNGSRVTSKKSEKFTEEFIQKQVEEFNIGKRHLANMMGEDPENFTQEDIDNSIAYLFPSGLFERRSRPIMKHPEEIFPKQKAVQWGADRRPFHFLFYTGKPSYYSLMHETFDKLQNIEKYQDHLMAKGLFSKDSSKVSLGSSRWLTKDELEEKLVENISTHNYDHFIQLMERLLSMPYCSREETFIQSFRMQLQSQSMKQTVTSLQRDERGVAYTTAEGQRKTSTSSVVLRDGGAGRITINGQEMIQYLPVLQDREQLMFPLQFMDMLGRFDLECTVSGGGRCSQAGALRLAISRALLGFLSEGDVEKMRQAGLLTPDPRVKERNKPGQEGARRKFTWKKR